MTTMLGRDPDSDVDSETGCCDIAAVALEPTTTATIGMMNRRIGDRGRFGTCGLSNIIRRTGEIMRRTGEGFGRDG